MAVACVVASIRHLKGAAKILSVDQPPMVTSVGVRRVERLFNMGVALGAVGRSDEAIDVCDDVLARYGDAPEPALREQVARALVNRGLRARRVGSLRRGDRRL